ncbi:MAG: glycerophosphodiester phosphodiesterase family protein [Planctomycetia bacterium]|nr:glycerophosphodiester phosphodiesterase family protein [Planctomycetia bacterium]
MFSPKFILLQLTVFSIFKTAILYGEIPQNPSPFYLPCVAHRGFSAIKPENTMIAMKAGIEVGADGNEMDVRLSADGIPFLIHDDSLKRYTGEQINPCKLTIKELQTRDVGSHKSAAFKGEPIPTLDEIIAIHVGTKTIPVIELKQDGMEAQTLEVLKKYNMVKKSVIIAFSANACKKMRELEPDIFIAWLSQCKKNEPLDVYAERIIRTCKDCNINAVDMQHGEVNREIVEKLHSAGLTVLCWTVDQPERMRQCIAAGVDSITTNRPDKLLEILKEKEKEKAPVASR